MAPIQSSLSPSRLVKLSQIISRNSNLLNSYLVEKKLAQPSFSVDAPLEGIIIEKNEARREELEKARKELVIATKELHDLSVGPLEGVRELTWSYHSQLSLHFIHQYGVARAFAPGSTITFEELSKKTKAPLHDLQRLVRHAISNRIFAEPAKNTIMHTAASKLLAQDPEIQAWVGMNVEDLWPSAVKTVEAMQKWPHSQEPTHTGFSVNIGEEKHMFQYMMSDPRRAAQFGTAMKDFSDGEGFEIENLVKNYDWARLGNKGVVVDVGGSHGYASAAVAKAFPDLRFIVQDLARVYKGIEPLERIPEEVRDRVQFMPHDFFQPQPVVGADVYLIRWCVHNWPDKYAIKMLQALIPGLKKGARVLINDGVLPEPMKPGASWKSSAELTEQISAKEQQEVNEDESVDVGYLGDRRMRTLDLVMLELLNTKERDLDQWKQLFREADERFIWKGAWKSGSMWLIEAEWAG